MYRCFIVIDDVWDIESWKMIRNGLDDNALGSKIVITTRKHDVAKEVGCYYKMEPLSHASSKILFFTRIFGCEDRCCCGDSRSCLAQTMRGNQSSRTKTKSTE
jgi:disease resistance protein RPM1